jgi:hypothetical protein
VARGGERDARRVHQLRPHPACAQGVRGEGGQRVEGGHRVGGTQQRRHLRRDVGQQGVVQLALARARPLLR